MREKKESEHRFIDLFSGIGGFRLGMERQGFKCVWSCDIDKYANQVYGYRFGGENHETRDIKEVEAGKIPDHNILCAGFPCQSFSVAGKRRGFDDTRGTLFFEICRIARAKKPGILFLENVKGLLSHEKGRTFATIINSLQELGYSLEWQVLDSQHFGVPQHRERVFIIGHLGELSGQQIFPVGEVCGVSDEARTGSKAERERISSTITSRYFKGGLTDPYVLQPIVNTGSSYRIYRSYRVYDPEGIAPTVPSFGGYVTPKVRDQRQIRRLTPKECERLQGFPDDWTKYGMNEKGEKVGISDTQRYKMIGNAVTVNVIEAIAKRMREVVG